MDPDRETEVMLNMACGLDPLSAIVAASDERPPQRSGCLTALIVVGGILWAFAQL